MVPGSGFSSCYPAAVTTATDADAATVSSVTASLAVTTTTAVPGSGFLSCYPAAAITKPYVSS